MANRQLYPQTEFRLRLREEWRRSERSGKTKILVLLHGFRNSQDTRGVVDLLSGAIRETDIMGWYAEETTLGVLLLELGRSEALQAIPAVEDKLRSRVLTPLNGTASTIKLESHVFPSYSPDGDAISTCGGVFDVLWSDGRAAPRILEGMKRVIDVCVSSLLLLLLSPLLAAIAFCIRMTSSGPAFFRQARVGFRGRTFALYKFRTMHQACDDRAHREYVSRFIDGCAEEHIDERGQSLFKMANDGRVTRLGRVLRRSSLDELPQLWNVLRGDMSLVGPRPPLPYEVERYQLWHCKRVYDLKPGLTGLWQVRGRSRCTFEEMTRMDLQHAKPNSLGLYFRVLAATPTAVLHGHGAQ